MAEHFSTQPYRPHFLSTPGDPQIAWSRWRLMFQDWLVAIGFPDADDFRVRKAALLRASLGAEGSRIYYSYSANPLTDTYDAVVQIMDRHFGTPSGVIYNRAQFTRCMQRSGEPLVQFLAELRELARKGDFRPICGGRGRRAYPRTLTARAWR